MDQSSIGHTSSCDSNSPNLNFGKQIHIILHFLSPVNAYIMNGTNGFNGTKIVVWLDLKPVT